MSSTKSVSRRRGRPLTAGGRRDSLVKTYLSAAEKTKARELAAAYGLTESDLMRAAFLHAAGLPNALDQLTLGETEQEGAPLKTAV